MRQREDDMEVGDGQQHRLLGGQPAGRVGGQTFGTMPIATRVVSDAAVATPVTARDMAAEQRGATAGDGTQHPTLGV